MFTESYDILLDEQVNKINLTLIIDSMVLITYKINTEDSNFKL